MSFNTKYIRLHSDDQKSLVFLPADRLTRVARSLNHDIFDHPMYRLDSPQIKAQLKPANLNNLEYYYKLFDDLMELDKNFVKRRVIGKDEWGYDIREYVFAADTNMSRGTGEIIPSLTEPYIKLESLRKPNILVMAGIHGHEVHSLETFYLMLLEIMTNYKEDEWCNRMYNNVQITIVPCMNPSGVVDDIRRNRGGVDLNRNFPTDWRDLGGDGGSGPASALSTQTIIKWVGEWKGRNIGMLELHDQGGNSVVWGAAIHPVSSKLFVNSLQEFTQVMNNSALHGDKKPTDVTGNRTWGWYDTDVPGGCTRHMAMAMQQPSILLEHAGIGNRQAGGNIYWCRFAYRALTRILITRMVDRAEMFGFFDDVYGDEQ